MTNPELDARLKAAREPSLPAGYQETFTRNVLNNLRSSPGGNGAGRKGNHWVPKLAWGLATAACILMAFALGHWRGPSEKSSRPAVLADAKLIRETRGLFPHRVRAIVQDENGLKLVLADQGEMPASTPIYIRICDGNKCSSLVTFSGQEIQIAGQKLTVLSQSDGGIILEGNQFVWSSREPVAMKHKIRIEARNLT